MKLLILSLACAMPFCSFSQSDSTVYKNDIGVSISPIFGAFINFEPITKTSLQYRRRLNRKFHLKATFTGDAYYETAFEKKQLTYQPDTSYVLRSQYSRTLYHDIRLGGEYLIKGPFSIGANLIVGRMEQSAYIDDQGFRKDSSGHYYDDYTVAREFNGASPSPGLVSDNTSARTLGYQAQVYNYKYLSVGMMMEFALNFNLYKRLNMSVSYSPQFIHGMRIKTKEYDDVVGYWEQGPESINQFDHYLDVHIRYSFPRKG